MTAHMLDGYDEENVWQICQYLCWVPFSLNQSEISVMTFNVELYTNDFKTCPMISMSETEFPFN